MYNGAGKAIDYYFFTLWLAHLMCDATPKLGTWFAELSLPLRAHGPTGPPMDLYVYGPTGPRAHGTGPTGPGAYRVRT